MKTCWIGATCFAVLALATQANATLLVHYQLDGNLNEVPGTGSQTNVLDAVNSSGVVVAPNGSAYVAGVPGLGGQALVVGSTGGSNVQWAGTPDGSDPDLGGLPSATDWTVELFFQPKVLPADNQFARLALHWGSLGQAYHLTIRNLTGSTGPRLDIFTDYSGNQSVNGSTDLATDTWYYGAAVKSGSTVTLYLNGVSQGSYTVSGNMSNSNNQLYFGSTPTQSPFLGYLDDIRVWNEAVSGSYLTSRAALLVPEPSSFAMLLLGGIAAIRLVGRKRGHR